MCTVCTYSNFFLACKLYNSGMDVVKYFGHGQCFIRGFLVFRFLVFSVYKNLMSSHHLLYLAIFADLKMFQFWYTYYTCILILDMSEILGNIYT